MTMVPAQKVSKPTLVSVFYGGGGGGLGSNYNTEVLMTTPSLPPDHHLHGYPNYTFSNANNNNNNNNNNISPPPFTNSSTQLPDRPNNTTTTTNCFVLGNPPMVVDELEHSRTSNSEAAVSSTSNTNTATPPNQSGSWLQLGLGGSTHHNRTTTHHPDQLADDPRAHIGLGGGSSSTTATAGLMLELNLGGAVASPRSQLQTTPLTTDQFHAPPPTNFTSTASTLLGGVSFLSPPPFAPHHQQLDYMGWGLIRNNHHHYHHQQEQQRSSTFLGGRSISPSASSSSGSLMPVGGSFLGRPNSSDIRIIDPPPRRPHSGIWFMLQASQHPGREPFLPQVPKSFLRIKDGRMTVRLVMRYLANKLGLDSESQVEIRCRGQQLVPFLTLQYVRDNIWSSRDVVTLLPDSSTSDHVMVLHYGRI